MKIGFIGVGVMGKPMVLNLLKHSFEVAIYARNPQKVTDLIDLGVPFYSSVKDITKNSDILFTMVGYPTDVEEIYFGRDQILENAKEGLIVIDMTTSSPSLAIKIYQEAHKKNVFSLDCPVTGGDVGAKNGTLTMFAAGNENVFKRVEPILRSMGKNICFCGVAGNGQHAKLANQIAIAGSLAAVSELYAYAKENQLDIECLLPYWQSGSAGSFQMNTSFPKALKNDFEPGFYTKHFIKDMKLAIHEAQGKGLHLKMLETVSTMFEELQNDGFENKGTQIITKYYEKK